MRYTLIHSPTQSPPCSPLVNRFFWRHRSGPAPLAQTLLPVTTTAALPQLLADLPNGQSAVVARVVPSSTQVDLGTLRRLGEIGFIAGEVVRVVRRGPGGREPLAVQVGDSLFALRLPEAQSIEVRPSQTQP